MYVMRQLTKPFVRLVALIGVSGIVVGSVSISNVIENTFNVDGVPGFLNYALSAVSETELLVQVSITIVTAIVAWSGFEIVRRNREERAFLSA